MIIARETAKCSLRGQSVNVLFWSPTIIVNAAAEIRHFLHLMKAFAYTEVEIDVSVVVLI